MNCYVLVYVFRGIIETVTAYYRTPQGLEAAKKDARKIIVDSYTDQDTIGLYEQTKGETGGDILKDKEMKRWLIKAGKSEQADWYF